MKILCVKRVPKEATKYTINGVTFFRLVTERFTYRYEPFTNCCGEHVFCRYAYSVKPKNLAK